MNTSYLCSGAVARRGGPTERLKSGADSRLNMASYARAEIFALPELGAGTSQIEDDDEDDYD
jgi:hypothetical protein